MDPFTALVLSLVLTAGSAGANTVAANRIQSQRDDYNAAERIRQRKYDQEAQGLNTQSQDRYDGFSGQQEESAKRLGDYFADQAATPAPEAAAAMPVSTSDIVTREIAKRTGAARDFTNQQAESLGALRSFGDLLGDTSRLQARDASLIGQIGGFKRGSASVLPHELEAANEKGAGFKLLGDILAGASAVTGSMGAGGPLSGIFGSAAPAVSPAAGAAAAAGRAPGFLAASQRAKALIPTLYPTARLVG